MRAVDVRTRLRQRPFTPFRIRLTDGIVHVVRHPEGAFVTDRNVVVGVPRNGDRPGDYHDYALVTLLHVIQIDPITTLPEPTKHQSEGENFS